MCHCLEHLGLSLDMCKSAAPLRPVNPEKETRHRHQTPKGSRAFIWNEENGNAEWATVEEGPLRLTLCADEGSALYAGFRFLCHHNLSVHLLRDELCLCRAQRSWSSNDTCALIR